VLKLLVPRANAAAEHEITVLRLADGDGCARLLRHDASRGALLLERLGPSMYDLRVPIDARLDLLADVARRVWRPAPGVDLPTGREKAVWLADHIVTSWDELDRPCSERAIEDALVCAHRRMQAHDDERAVLVHGDVHQWNALRAHDGGGYKLVDPDGLLAEPEYDLGIIMREDPVELLHDPDPHHRAHRLARRTRLDPTAIWEWGVVERVSTGLLATRIDLQPAGREMLATADAVAA
jgi:streptomycin 6-kinase